MEGRQSSNALGSGQRSGVCCRSACPEQHGVLNAMSSLNRRESSHMSESAATTAMRSANTTTSSQLVRTKVSGMVLSAADSRTDYRKLGIFGSLLAISGRSCQSPVRMSHPVGD